jgi:hypothetical protein
MREAINKMLAKQPIPCLLATVGNRSAQELNAADMLLLSYETSNL